MDGKRGKVKKICIDIPRRIPYNSKAMWLDLRDVIEVPGASASFETELDAEHLLTPSIRGFNNGPPRARGTVTNTAGLLALRVYQGRAFYDGTGGLERSELERLSRLYGLIVL